MWVAIFFCIFKGPRLTGFVTYATMGIPLLLLIVFAILFGSMPGGNEGVKEYFTFDIGNLAGEEPCGSGPCRDAWSKAVAQVFFSIGITFGVMTAYAAANNKEQSIFVNALVVSLSDFLVAILAGFPVFTAVGFYAK